MVKTYFQIMVDARKELLGTEEPEMASRLVRELLCFYSGKSPAELLSHGECYASRDLEVKMQDAIARLIQGEPLPYIIGQWDFYGLTLSVTPAVLIPRDDTCAVVDLAVSKGLFLPESPRILDLCTGSGCIGLAIASRLPDARVTLGDISLEALAVAKKNVTALKYNARVSCVQADALKRAPAFLGKFDMIVSNPPYITGEEMKALPVSVKDYEPEIALYGGYDGLDFYRSITRNYLPALKPGGYLAFEFGMGQGNAVYQILQQNGFEIIEQKKDFNDRLRAMIARNMRKDD